MNTEYLMEIREVYKRIKPLIEARIDGYKSIWFNGNNEDVHVELAFCILTPQSKARGAEKAIDGMRNAGVFWTGIEDDLIPYLNVVRFKNTKAKNLVILREFMKDEEGRIITKTLVDKMGDVFEKRIWLVKNIKGIGYKEASHFLRNIGFGDEIAILDRHILKNIMRLEVIDEIPKTITPKKYLEIEKKIEKYCREIEIPMDHFDLLLWYLEAGEVFK
ncbi:N-glycosylase/DNA lyase [Psychrilyobacter atlanticus]|uniref:N-glycosylase/DNA lyase n=1 Tax=Psychrilyobacter atlanticus TaxID=271091 RepID=UPI00040D7A87|nr:N-glycosylase/DNA lyase [Psychrilyobacter atlanticus]